MDCWRGSAGARARSLVIRGEAGIGKTALLRYAARQASGFRVAQLTGVEAEMELPFAGTHQLCAAMLDRLDALPAPQRDALSVALGLVGGEVPDRFLSDWPCSACCPRWRRSGRCSVSSRTRSGWMPPRARSSASSRDGCARSRWRSWSPCASRLTGARLRRSARAPPRRAARTGCPHAAGERRHGPARQPRR